MTLANVDYRQLVRAMVEELALGASHTVRTKAAVSSTPTTIYGHGSGGLFSHHALEQPVLSAMILPHQGLQGRLPLYANRYTDPLYGIITGVTATTGTEPTGPCDDFPVAGTTKLCMQHCVFGRQGRMSRVFELDRIGQLTDRGEHFDFRLVGNPWDGVGHANTPTIPGMGDMNAALNREYAKAAFELAVSWTRDFAREFYTGNPTNNTANGGRKYYRGLDRLINTGYQDAITEQACPAADSVIWSFGNKNVSSNGGALVRELTNVYRRLKYIAERAGLAPVKWVFGMRWAAFYEITEIWPCAYHTYRCQTSFSTSQTQFVDSQRLIEMRDDMRGNQFEYTGQYLLIDGEKVEVVIDDAIDEQGIGAGEFRSSIYILPMTVQGGIPVTYMEYFPYDGSEAPGSAMEFARAMGVDGYYKVSDDRRFLWHFKPPTNFCVQFLIKTEPRLVLRTPYLAARFTGVQYTPVQHERDPFTDSVYFADGGRTDYNGYGPSYYSPTA